MFFNKIKKYIQQKEVLEIDIKKQLLDKKNKYGLYFIKILFIKLFRSLYRTIQRSVIKPTLRVYMIKFEKYFVKLFSNSPEKNMQENSKAMLLKQNSFLKLNNLFNDNELKEIEKYLISRENSVEIYENNLNKQMDM